MSRIRIRAAYLRERFPRTCGDEPIVLAGLVTPG